MTDCNGSSKREGGGIAGRIEDGLTVLLEGLAREDLGEEISVVRVTWNVTNNSNTSATQLAHLEQLSIDVT